MLPPELSWLHLLPLEVRVLVGECVGQGCMMNTRVGVVGYLDQGEASSVLETLGEFLKRTGLMTRMMRDRQLPVRELKLRMVTDWYRWQGRPSHQVSWDNCASPRWQMGKVYLTNFVGEINHRVKAWEDNIMPLEVDAGERPATKRMRRTPD